MTIVSDIPTYAGFEVLETPHGWLVRETSSPQRSRRRWVVPWIAQEPRRVHQGIKIPHVSLDFRRLHAKCLPTQVVSSTEGCHCFVQHRVHLRTVRRVQLVMESWVNGQYRPLVNGGIMSTNYLL